jgi:hypothetical protein
MHRPDVITNFQQMGRKAMTKSMAASISGDLRQTNSVLYYSLGLFGIDVMSPLLT